MEKELIIDEKNFDKYFRQTNKNKPEKDEVIACYRAKAYLVNGDLKENIINLLKKDKKNSAIKLLTDSAYCLYEDAVKINESIYEDLNKSVPEEEILKKEHPYTIEMFYYTKEEYVPKKDQHWSIIKIVS